MRSTNKEKEKDVYNFNGSVNNVTILKKDLNEDFNETKKIIEEFRVLLYEDSETNLTRGNSFLKGMKPEDIYWFNFDVLDFYMNYLLSETNDEVIKSMNRFYDHLLNYLSDTVASLRNKEPLDLNDKNAENALVNFLGFDIESFKANQRRIFYDLLSKSKEYEEFKGKVYSAISKEISLEKIIDGTNIQDFYSPQKTFFNLLYYGKLNPSLKTPITFLDVKIKNSDNSMILEDILPLFEQYLVDSKIMDKADAESFVDLSYEIFINRRDYHNKISEDISSVLVDLGKRKKEVYDILNSKKELNKRIYYQNKEDKVLLEYIQRLKQLNSFSLDFINKINSSYFGYLITLNLLYDKFDEDGINVKYLIDAFNENDDFFKRNNLFNIGKELVDKKTIYNSKYDDPIEMAYVLIEDTLNTIRSKIKNFTYDNFKEKIIRNDKHLF